MAEETPAAPAPGIVTELSGGVTRVQSDGNPDGQAKANADSQGVTAKPEAGTEVAAPATGLPEGYASVEDFVKAVNDGTYKAPEAKPAETPAEGGLPPEIANHPKVGAAAKEFAETGKLSDETIKTTAEALGVPEALVKAYADNAIAAKTLNDESVAFDAKPFHDLAGGDKGWNEFVDWANSALSAEELATFGKAVDTDSKIGLALAKTHYAAYREAGGGAEPRDLSNLPGGAGDGGDVYESMAQVTKDMANPDYAKDPAFRAKVEAKLSRSKI